MKKQLATLILAITVLGCNSSKQTVDSMSTEINNTTWELTMLEGQNIEQSSVDGKKVNFTLNSADNTISGYSGCNIFSGKYTLENGGRIKISQLASTRMACPDAKINETDILKVFELTDNYSIQNGILSMNVGKRAPLATFKRASMDNPIVEKYWKLISLNGKAVKMTANQEREIFFTLKNQDNRVSGFAGCNSISGEFILEKGNRIRFNNMATTMRACPDINVNESELLNVFNTTDNYTINVDTLSLNVGRRAPLAVFEAIYMK